MTQEVIMKINSNPFDGIRQTVESEATKAKEQIQSGAEKAKEFKESNEGCAPKVTPESTLKEARAFLDIAGQANRSKMDKLFDGNRKPNLEPKEGSLSGDVLVGAREGADAGNKSGRQAAVDTNAVGPHSLAGAAGAIVGGLSGAIDGFNGHQKGASSDQIRKEARANGDYSGGIAGQRAMFLDNSAGENATYPKYKEYQANGGTKSYNEWVADSNYYGGNNSGGGTHAGSSVTTPTPPANNNPTPSPSPNPPANNNNNAPLTNPWPYATGEETVEDPPEDQHEDEPPPVIYGDPNKTQQTTYVDTSLMKSDEEAVDDLI